ncbi:hypothetical protein [Zobellella aerophila]|uniref:ATP-grasp domain-containing protein n=1 Tax=Zobellella aerophila TaxID=870480 RepID=A0ABP6VHT1_9GAMM
MREVLIVTTPDGFFAQKEMPWSSMDVSKVSAGLGAKGFHVTTVDFDYIKNNISAIKDKIIIYTSSQRTEHKRYIEDVMYFLKDSNFLIPSYEALKAHDNKGFQLLLNAKYILNVIPGTYIADVSEINQEQNYPCVFKPANGASSTGVAIVNNINEIRQKVNGWLDFSLRDLKKIIKKHIIPFRYNSEWENYLDFGKKRFILQKFMPGLTCDYKVLIFGDKFYALKRFVAKNDFRASGSGLHSRDFDGELEMVLEQAYQFSRRFRSHIYSLDICVADGETWIIEFQFTHVGPVTLSESPFYFVRAQNGVWNKVMKVSDLEDEFVLSITGYIHENTALCS